MANAQLTLLMYSNDPCDLLIDWNGCHWPDLLSYFLQNWPREIVSYLQQLYFLLKNPIWGYSRWSTFCLVCPICFCWLSLPFDKAKTRSLLQLTYKLSWLTRMFSIQHVVLSFCQKCICRSFLEQVLDATTAILHTLLVLFLLPATCKLCRAFDAYKSAFFVSKHIPGL